MWNPDQYERFKSERSQPFWDLVALIRPHPHMRIADLGCGTGELTRALHEKLQARETIGVDNSAPMLAKAPSAPGLQFRNQSIESFNEGGFDLIFSNAALHWVPDHERLFRRLALLGKQIAVQMPANDDHPSHTVAAEVARGDPTAVVLASHDQELARELQKEIAGQTFRLYTNDDVLGVELAGAMKNVIAIAAGACHGIGLGSNSLAALITRGLAEMTRLAVKLGAKPETLGGLAGLGDLVLTCTGSLSRNRYVGVELGKGRPLAEILAGMRMVAEGVGTTDALVDLARAANVEMPITGQVQAILRAERSARDAIRAIMERPLKPE